MAGEIDTGPYLGPQPFERKHRSLFFGRRAELQQLRTMVLSNPVVVLYAGSGAGKTSLLKAGLIPLLEEQEEFQVLPLARVTGAELLNDRPASANPFVRGVISSWLPESEHDASAADLTITDYLDRNPHPEARDGWSAPRLIVVDQLEEIFTLRPHHWQQRDEFFGQLRDAIRADPLLRVVLAIREDYMYELEPQRVRLPGRLRARFRLDLLREAAALDAVVLPIKETPRRFAPGVAEKLVEDLRTASPPSGPEGEEIPLAEFVEPVQLQVTCAALWQALPSDRTEITAHDVRHFGDVDQALRSLYDLAIALAAEAADWREGNLREQFAGTFITSIDTRGTAYLSDQGVGGMPWKAVHVLEGRHVIRAEWRSNAHWYELTHDRLIGPIRASNRRFVLNELTGIHQGQRAVPVVLGRTRARDKFAGRVRETDLVTHGATTAETDQAEDVGHGVALCLTGGGYRSMLFAAGALWRLNEAGFLPRLQQVSSNSGAAVTAALVGLGWQRLEFDSADHSSRSRFEEVVISPLRELAATTLDTRVAWSSIVRRRNGSAGLADEYERRLFGDAPLSRLPDSPRFVFTSSHLASGQLWRFGKDKMGNERTGWIERPETGLADAVAASGANPPMLSPAVLQGGGTADTVLTSGSLYDTLALETAWRRYDTVLVCDAKGARPIAHAARRRLNHFMDFVAASDTELHRLRRQQALLAYTSGIKQGGYWSINSHLASFPVDETLTCPPEQTARARSRAGTAGPPGRPRARATRELGLCRHRRRTAGSLRSGPRDGAGVPLSRSRRWLTPLGAVQRRSGKHRPMPGPRQELPCGSGPFRAGTVSETIGEPDQRARMETSRCAARPRPGPLTAFDRLAARLRAVALSQTGSGGSCGPPVGGEPYAHESTARPAGFEGRLRRGPAARGYRRRDRAVGGCVSTRDRRGDAHEDCSPLRRSSRLPFGSAYEESRMPGSHELSAMSPVSVNTGEENGKLEEGIALCLSGGGYRAMLFHVGALWRLNELAYLSKLHRISSVSGGSITAATLALAWPRLVCDGDGAAPAFQERVVSPLRDLARQTIDAGSILGGILRPGKTIGDKVTDAYRKHLFGDATLQQLPERPRFVINATNVQTGSLWRFSKPYMADYRVGVYPDPAVDLAVAVAASSAFPPVLSPLRLSVDPNGFSQDRRGPQHLPPYTSEVVLSDGGVYDNLGLETAWKRYRTVLVSDGGGQMGPEPKPRGDWVRHSIRVNEVIDNQVRSMRKRQTIAGFQRGDRDGAYWGIRSRIDRFGPPGGALPCEPSADAGAGEHQDAVASDARRAPRAADQLGLRGLRRRHAHACRPRGQRRRCAAAIPVSGARSGVSGCSPRKSLSACFCARPAGSDSRRTRRSLRTCGWGTAGSPPLGRTFSSSLITGHRPESWPRRCANACSCRPTMGSLTRAST